MAGYIEYKDSGIPWIGTIPSHWEIQRNKNCFSCEKNIVGLRSSEVQLLSLTTTGIKKKSFDDIGGKVPESYDTYQIVRKNDIVMCLFDLDCSAVFSGLSKYDGMISPAYKVIRCKDTILPGFADYWFRSVFVGRKFKYLAKNIRYSLTYEDFSALTLPLPSLSEQMAIVEHLDAVCADIDQVIAEAKGSIEEYKAWKVSIVYEAVTKGLNPKAALKDSGFEWIGLIPSHWKLAPNKRVMHKEKRICEEYAGQDIISLTMNGVIVRDLGAGGKMPTSFDGYQYVYPGELLMCLFDIDVTPRCVGRVYNEGLTSPAYSSFVLHDGANLDYYYYYYLMMDNTKELLHLSKNLRHSLTEEQLGQIKVPVPPMDEQIEIGRVLDRKTSQIDALIAEKEALIKELDAYKKSLIFEVVTGKRKVV